MAWSRCCAALCLALSAAALPAAADPGDPLGPLISHAESFLHREESEGVTLDRRHFYSLPEHLRLTVVPQLAAFCDLYRFSPTDARMADIVERADYLVRLGRVAMSGDAADGMLAYALLKAYEITGNVAYRDGAQPIISRYLVAPVADGDVNRVLMIGLGLAQYRSLNSDPVATTRLDEILLLVARSQHADGSFDHVCDGARDVHYTTWTAMELDLVGRLYENPNLPRMLDRAQGFLLRRVAGDGTTSYDETLSTGAMVYYYSKPVCPSDYDTRGWVNELAYNALVFDRAKDFRYNQLMNRLLNLEAQGAWPDKWGYLPAWSDPSYVWSTAPRSVVRTSLVLWSLAAIQSRRGVRGQTIYMAPAPPSPSAEITSSVAASRGEEAAWERDVLSLSPNPARENAWIALRLPRSADVKLVVLDATGRRVRDLLHENQAAGTRVIRWDGRDQAGARVPAGVYFVRLEAEGRIRSARLVWIETGR